MIKPRPHSGERQYVVTPYARCCVAEWLACLRAHVADVHSHADRGTTIGPPDYHRDRRPAYVGLVVLADPDDYPAWNPMIAGLKGPLVKGAVIENIEGSGADRTIIWPRILVADRNRELRWRGHLWGLPGVFIGEHYFLLRATPRGTLFTQGERFNGVLLWMFDPRDLLPAFEAMNVALAKRAEKASRPTVAGEQ